MFEKLLKFLGMTATDIAENARNTKSDVKSNKSSKRNYTFDDGMGFTEEDFKRAKEEAKKEGHKKESKTPTKDDDNIK